MDVNGTRFHLVLGRGDWLPPEGGGAPAGASWDDHSASVGLTALPIVFPPRKNEAPPRAEDRRGAGRDRFGNWYWIGDDGASILARAPRDARPLPFWPAPETGTAVPVPPAAGDFAPVEAPPDPAPPRLQGLAVTGEHYLVAGNLDEPGLLVFDLAAGGPPLALRWPGEVPFTPWDVCAAPDGGVWLLDRANARLWSLDRLFRVRRLRATEAAAPEPDFTPALAAEPEYDGPAMTEGPVTLDAAVDLSFVLHPTAVEALADGSALVLGEDGAGPVLHRVTLEEGETAALPLAPLLAAHPEVLAELPFGHEMAFVPAGHPAPDGLDGTVFVTAPAGNQSFAFTVAGTAAEPEVAFDPRFYPMRRYGGRALVAAEGEAHYDSGSRWVSLLEYPRPSFEREAVLTLPTHAGAAEAEDGREPLLAFDGREPGCVWHRLFLDGCIPPEASVLVESRAADSEAELLAAEWTPEPAPYLRTGPELPFRETLPEGPEGESGSWELLFQNAVGRWLQLRLTLRGNGRVTPKLRALRAYYPRFSFLREYLPAVWREDAGSAWFLDRYLANVEGTFTEVEGRIAAAQMLFDTATVPAEFLEWLGGWMGATLDTAWSEEKQRFFVRNAMRMFAGRGTREGIVRALRLALEERVDPCLFEEDCGCGGAEPAGAFTVRVVERFLTRAAAGVAYGDVGDLAGPGSTAPTLAWTPAQGPEPLHERWRGWLATRYADVDALKDAWGTAPGEPDYASLADPRLRLPSVTPAGAAKAADWRRFLAEGLGFTWEVPDPRIDLPLWHDFLARRYRFPAELNRAWALPPAEAYGAFESVPYPATLPEQRTRLADWITFVSVVVPMRRGAHRFTVLVPVAPGETREAQRRRRDLAERIAVLEKPAHTVVDTRLYWAAFRVGEARLGIDTVLGEGSRFTALVLDRGELADSYLGWTEPWNVRGRRVVGRDPVTRSRSTGTLQRWT